MKYSERFDERQKIIRGKAFLYGYITFASLMFLSAIIREIDSTSFFTDVIQFFICLLLSLVVCVINMIKNDAIDGIFDNYGRFAAIGNGVLGLIVIGSALVRTIKNNVPIISNGMESEEFGEIVLGIFPIVICVAYWVHRIRTKKTIKNEELNC